MLPKCRMDHLRKRFRAVCLGLAIALMAPFGARGDFYIATNGNDAWSGLLPAPNATATDGPFATLEAARNAIRSLKAVNGLPAGGLRVNLRGGRYMRQSPFTLCGWLNDSGTPSSPTVYQSYPGETACVIGGMSVAGFQPVTNQATLVRLKPAARTNVVVASLLAQGITNIVPLARHGFGLWWNWSGQNELFFQDQPMQLARWPNSNWLTTASSPAPGTNSFAYAGTNPSTWASFADVWVQGYWYWDWADECDLVPSVDTTNHIVYVASPASQYGYAPNQRFYFLNVLEELDSPGEYYIDRVNGLLYFWPPGGLAGGNPFISMVGAGLAWWAGGIVNLDSVSNIVLQGITFEGAAGSLIYMQGGQSNLVSGCVLIGSACDGVDINGSPGSGVSYCQISSVGEMGINVWSSGDRPTLAPGQNFAIGNTIQDMSRLCRTYNPAICVQGVGNWVAHNLICNGPHQAIHLYANNNLVEYQRDPPRLHRNLGCRRGVPGPGLDHAWKRVPLQLPSRHQRRHLDHQSHWGDGNLPGRLF